MWFRKIYYILYVAHISWPQKGYCDQKFIYIAFSIRNCVMCVIFIYNCAEITSRSCFWALALCTTTWGLAFSSNTTLCVYPLFPYLLLFLRCPSRTHNLTWLPTISTTFCFVFAANTLLSNMIKYIQWLRLQLVHEYIFTMPWLL